MTGARSDRRQQHLRSGGHALGVAACALAVLASAAAAAETRAPAETGELAASVVRPLNAASDKRELRDEGWREAARQRIEQHRKADFEITVRDAAGRPIPNAAVTIAMKRHRFGFGALMGTLRWADRPNTQDAQRHLALAAERFNKVVTILRPDDPSGDVALDWLRARGIRVRGHYLMWSPVQPDRNRMGQPAEIFGLPAANWHERMDEAMRARIRAAAFAHLEQVLRFAGTRVAEWDVINHLALDSHPRYGDLFGPEIYADVIRRARELAPHAEMWVNEGNVLTGGERSQKYHDAIAGLIARGAKPDGIGFMAHFRENGLTPPEEVYQRLERFAALIPNLQLTELDIDTANERRQGEYMRDILTIAYSHPAVSGIVMWQTWGAGAGHKALWRPDWSIKPAGQAWLDHVFKLWWTEASGTTDASGAFRTRAFLGDYEITARRGNETRRVSAQVSPGGGSARIVF